MSAGSALGTTEGEAMPGGRLAAAFRLRANLEGLWRGGDRRIAAVDGLRALSILWLLAFHTFMTYGFFIPVEEFRGLLDSVPARLLAHGHYGVDIFFVISGFLIASLLLREHEETGQIRLGQFYARRALRLLPAYYLVLACFAWLGGRATTAWANLLYVNNFLPASEQTMQWAWSLAVEEQFYLLFPLLLIGMLRFLRRPVVAVALAFAAGLAIRAWIVDAYRLQFPSPVGHPVLDLPLYNELFDLLYDKPYACYAGLAMGVLIAFVHRRSATPLRCGRWTYRALVAGSAACILAALIVPEYINADPLHRKGLGRIYLIGGPHVFTLGIGGLLAAALSERGSTGWLRALSWPVWRPIALLSYPAYLIQPIVISMGYRWVLPVGGQSAAAISGHCVLFTAVVLVLSLPIHLWIEKPFMNLRPGSGRHAAGPGMRVSGSYAGRVLGPLERGRADSGV